MAIACARAVRILVKIFSLNRRVWDLTVSRGGASTQPVMQKRAEKKWMIGPLWADPLSAFGYLNITSTTT